MVNGAFFIASGEGAEMRYEKAYSVEPKSASFIDQITFHSGVLGVGGRFGFYILSYITSHSLFDTFFFLKKKMSFLNPKSL